MEPARTARPPAASAGGSSASWALWAALAAAAAIRLALWAHRGGPLWLEEDLPESLGFGLWGFDRGGFDPNPHHALWPHLSIYVYFAVQALQFAVGRVTGAYTSLADFYAAALLDPASLRGVAMLVSIAIALATIVAAAAVVWRWAGRAAAVAAAWILAVDPLYVRHALVISPDMLLTACVMMGLLAAGDVERRGRLGDSLNCGLWLGLGAACKYSPALLAFPIVVAHARRPGGRTGPAVLLDRRLWLSAGVAAAAFVLTTPFTVVDWLRHGGQVGVGVEAMTAGHFGTEREASVVRYALDVLPQDLGWPLWVALAFATVWAVARRARALAVPLAFLLPYAIVFGALPTLFPRYLLPVLPLVLLCGGVAASALARAPNGRRTLLASGAVAAAGLLVQSAATLSAFARTDTRTNAREWILANVPDRAVIATEWLGPALPDRAQFDRARAMPGVSARRRDQLARGPAYFVHHIPLSSQDPELTVPFYDPRLYLPFDGLIVSEGVRGRFVADAGRYPVQQAFYPTVDATFAVAYRSPSSGVVGPTLILYRPLAANRDTLERLWSQASAGFPAPRHVPPADRVAHTFAERGQLLEDADRQAQSRPDWRRATRWSGAPGSWWLHYGLSADAAGDWDEARVANAEAFRRDSTLTEAALSWSEDALRLGHWAEAESVLVPILARAPLGAEDRARAEEMIGVARRRGRAAGR